KVPFKEHVLDVGLLAASIVGERGHGVFLFSRDRERSWRLRKIAPPPPVELTPAGLRPQASPLLEEEHNPRARALIPDLAHPLGLHGPRLRASRTADNDPIDAVEVEFADRTY